MKFVRGKASQVIIRLVHSTDSIRKIMRDIGVGRSTFYNRWLKDPVFLAKYQEEQEIFESELRTLRFASKKRRLEERERLYDTLPDEYPDKLIYARVPVDEEGRRVQPGEAWDRIETVEYVVYKSNVPAKSAVLNDIERELEGVRLVADAPGSELDVSRIVEKRREQAAALERYRREERDRERAKKKKEEKAAAKK